MMEVQTAPEAAPAPVLTPIAPVEPKSGGTVSEIRLAAQRLAQRRNELKAERVAAESAPPAPESPPQEVEAAPAPQVVEPPSGETESADPAPLIEEPSIEAPRSWSAEDKEFFKTLPPANQQRLVELDRAREREVRRIQNEAADQRKGFDSERSAMAQARQQYENALPTLLQSLQSSGEFADIRTIDDVTALAHNDWPRYVQWDAHQKKIAAVQQELQGALQRQEQERSEEWESYSAKEDAAFHEKFPDADKLRQSAVDYLKDAGFSDREIGENWNAKAWRDHRMQGVILDAVRWRQAKAKADMAKKAPLPPVLKPAVTQPKPNPFAAEIQALEAKGGLSLREAARLNQLRRKAT